jgi:hypothetical protein
MQKDTSDVKDLSLATKRETKHLRKEFAISRQNEYLKDQLKISKKDQQIAALKM